MQFRLDEYLNLASDCDFDFEFDEDLTYATMRDAMEGYSCYCHYDQR